MKNSTFTIILTATLSCFPLIGADDALGHPAAQPHNFNRSPLSAAERAEIAKIAEGMRLFNFLSQPSIDETTASAQTALYANAATAPLRAATQIADIRLLHAIDAATASMRRESAIREAAMNREINRRNRIEDFAFGLAQVGVTYAATYTLKKIGSHLYKWWYTDDIKKKKTAAAELEALQFRMKQHAANVHNAQTALTLDLNQASVLAARQKLIADFKATTEEEKKLHEQMKEHLKLEMAQYFGIKDTKHEAKLADSDKDPIITAYMVAPPASGPAKLATPPAPAAA